MWWNVGPIIEASVKKEQIGNDKGKSDNLDGFLSCMRSKFGTMVRAWHMCIDPDGTGTVTMAEFTSALRHIGYIGNLKTLWYQLDKDGSGAISLAELDPKSAALLEKFRVKCIRAYGSMDEAWDNCVDMDRSGFVGLLEFALGVERVGYDDQDEIHQLFDALKVSYGSDTIRKHDVVFLDTWEQNKVDIAHRERLGKRWVNRDPYFQKLDDQAEVSLPGCSKSPPKSRWPHRSTLNAAMMEKAQNKDDTDYSTLTGTDQDAQWKAFLDFLATKYGSLPKAFDIMDDNHNGYLSLTEWQTAVSGVCQYCRVSDARRLFNRAVGRSGQTYLTWKDLGITQQQWVEYTLEKREMKQRWASAQIAGKSAAGLASRARSAEQKHAKRISNPFPWIPLAFRKNLPKGWGFPPNFDPRNKRVEHFDSF